MPDQKISDFDDYGTPDDDILFYGLYNGTDNFSIRGGDFLRTIVIELTSAFPTLGVIQDGYLELNDSVAINTVFTSPPTKGDRLEILRIGSGAVTHQITLDTGVTWDGTNDTANFGTDGDYLRAIAISATRYRILPGTTGVTFS